MKAAAYNEGVGGGFVCLLLKVPSASVSEYTASIYIWNGLSHGISEEAGLL